MYPRNMVCFRYIIVNTLHEGDNDDANNNIIISCAIVCGQSVKRFLVYLISNMQQTYTSILDA